MHRQACLDEALQDALQTSLKLASNISINVVLEYPKAAKVYFRYLRCLFVHHLETVATVDNATFAALVNALRQGLAADERQAGASASAIVQQCAGAVDSIGTYLFRHGRKATPAAGALRAQVQAMGGAPELFGRLLATLLRLVLFAERGAMKPIGGAVLSLMLASPEAFEKCKGELTNSQPHGPLREQLQREFARLHEGVRPNLEDFNKVVFCVNLRRFASNNANLFKTA